MDVKAPSRMTDPAVRAQFAWTEQVCAGRNWAFEAWSGADRNCWPTSGFWLATVARRSSRPTWSRPCSMLRPGRGCHVQPCGRDRVEARQSGQACLACRSHVLNAGMVVEQDAHRRSLRRNWALDIDGGGCVIKTAQERSGHQAHQVLPTWATYPAANRAEVWAACARWRAERRREYGGSMGDGTRPSAYSSFARSAWIWMPL